MFALTGPNSLSSTGSFEKSKVTELDLNLFNQLFNSKQTKQKIELNFTSCFSGLNVAYVFISRRTTVMKNNPRYKTRKITLKYVHDDKICPFYFYERSGKVTAAKGDLSIHINNIILHKNKPNTNLRLK
tara:strand:+ start:808 stop:1194 length:387 start_codon:yes stop_codon:yes gene_type:complete